MPKQPRHPSLDQLNQHENPLADVLQSLELLDLLEPPDAEATLEREQSQMIEALTELRQALLDPNRVIRSSAAEYEPLRLQAHGFVLARHSLQEEQPNLSTLDTLLEALTTKQNTILIRKLLPSFLPYLEHHFHQQLRSALATKYRNKDVPLPEVKAAVTESDPRLRQLIDYLQKIQLSTDPNSSLADTLNDILKDADNPTRYANLLSKFLRALRKPDFLAQNHLFPADIPTTLPLEAQSDLAGIDDIALMKSGELVVPGLEAETILLATACDKNNHFLAHAYPLGRYADALMTLVSTFAESMKNGPAHRDMGALHHASVALCGVQFLQHQNEYLTYSFIRGAFSLTKREAGVPSAELTDSLLQLYLTVAREFWPEIDLNALDQAELINQICQHLLSEEEQIHYRHEVSEPVRNPALLVNGLYWHLTRFDDWPAKDKQRLARIVYDLVETNCVMPETAFPPVLYPEAVHAYHDPRPELSAADRMATQLTLTCMSSDSVFTSLYNPGYPDTNTYRNRVDNSRIQTGKKFSSFFYLEQLITNWLKQQGSGITPLSANRNENTASQLEVFLLNKFQHAAGSEFISTMRNLLQHYGLAQITAETPYALSPIEFGPSTTHSLEQDLSQAVKMEALFYKVTLVCISPRILDNLLAETLGKRPDVIALRQKTVAVGSTFTDDDVNTFIRIYCKILEENERISVDPSSIIADPEKRSGLIAHVFSIREQYISQLQDKEDSPPLPYLSLRDEAEKQLFDKTMSINGVPIMHQMTLPADFWSYAAFWHEADTCLPQLPAEATAEEQHNRDQKRQQLAERAYRHAITLLVLEWENRDLSTAIPEHFAKVIIDGMLLGQQDAAVPLFQAINQDRHQGRLPPGVALVTEPSDANSSALKARALLQEQQPYPLPTENQALAAKVLEQEQKRLRHTLTRIETLCAPLSRRETPSDRPVAAIPETLEPQILAVFAPLFPTVSTDELRNLVTLLASSPASDKLTSLLQACESKLTDRWVSHAEKLTRIRPLAAQADALLRKLLDLNEQQVVSLPSVSMPADPPVPDLPIYPLTAYTARENGLASLRETMVQTYQPMQVILDSLPLPRQAHAFDNFEPPALTPDIFRLATQLHSRLDIDFRRWQQTQPHLDQTQASLVYQNWLQGLTLLTPEQRQAAADTDFETLLELLQTTLTQAVAPNKFSAEQFLDRHPLNFSLAEISTQIGQKTLSNLLRSVLRKSTVTQLLSEDPSSICLIDALESETDIAADATFAAKLEALAGIVDELQADAKKQTGKHRRTRAQAAAYVAGRYSYGLNDTASDYIDTKTSAMTEQPSTPQNKRKHGNED